MIPTTTMISSPISSKTHERYSIKGELIPVPAEQRIEFKQTQGIQLSFVDRAEECGRRTRIIKKIHSLRPCLECKTLFRPLLSTKKYCTRKCQMKRNSRLNERESRGNCLDCNKKIRRQSLRCTTCANKILPQNNARLSLKP